MQVFENIANIGGLTYVRRFVTPVQELKLLETIDGAPWDTALSRRVQHYGFRYDSTKNAAVALGPLPEWSSDLIAAIQNCGASFAPNQITVNEYEPGQGIVPHIDQVSLFGDTVVSVSLGSEAAMEFVPHPSSGRVPVSLCLERGSAVILSGDARYAWKHAISHRKTDKNAQLVGGGAVDIRRSRRVSVTFRQKL